MPPCRKPVAKGGTEGAAPKKTKPASSLLRKASSTTAQKGKTGDATNSSVPPGAIQWNPDDEDDEFVPISLAPNLYVGANASPTKDVTDPPPPLEAFVDSVKRISRRIFQGSPEQLRTITSKKPASGTRESRRTNRLPQKLDEIQEETSPCVAAAASTLIYAKAYGGSSGEEYDEEGSLGIADAATTLLYNEEGKDEEYDEEENEEKKKEENDDESLVEIDDSSDKDYSDYSDVITFDVDSDG